MTGWDIRPQAASAVLKKTAGVAEKLQGQSESYGTNMQNAAAHAGTLHFGDGEQPEAGLVGAALSEFAEAKTKDLLFVGARAGKSLGGASDALMEYLRGDQAQAEETIRDAAAALDMDAVMKEAKKQAEDSE